MGVLQRMLERVSAFMILPSKPQGALEMLPRLFQRSDDDSHLAVTSSTATAPVQLDESKCSTCATVLQHWRRIMGVVLVAMVVTLAIVMGFTSSFKVKYESDGCDIVPFNETLAMPMLAGTVHEIPPLPSEPASFDYAFEKAFVILPPACVFRLSL